MILGPRLVVAGTHSGVGKTTVATGIMAALSRRGVRVGAAKVGPDYIDPGYHALATGRPSRNLDAWMCGAAAIAPVAAIAAAGCDLLVVEGVMGLFDGAALRPAGSDPEGMDTGPGMFASTAHVARLLQAPVILVIDASAQSGSVAALVHGFSSFDPALGIAGVVLNRVAGDSHEAMLRDALTPLAVPVLGVLRRNPAWQWRDRHLGLVPVIEQRAELASSLDRLAAAVDATCDLEGLRAVAESAQPLPVEPLATSAGMPLRRPRIAIAGGPAFSFNYPDNLEALEAAGAELVPFDPADAPSLPERIDGLVAGGGFPEVHADALAANRPLLRDVRRRVDAGLVTWAECGGLLWLAASLDGRAMAGAVPCVASMTDRLTLGYREARMDVASPLGAAGTALRGHEFHYSVVDPPGQALTLHGRTGRSVGGFASHTLFASYLHQHLAGSAHLAQQFVAACTP